MADRHTAQSVLAALAARGRTVTDVDTAANTTAVVDGVRLEVTRARCTVAGWTIVPLGVCSPRGRTIEQINEAIRAAIERDERRKQGAAIEADWRRRSSVAASLSDRTVKVQAHLDATFAVTITAVPESAVADLVALIRRRLGETPSGGDEP